jgi:hypothetical protein
MTTDRPSLSNAAYWRERAAQVRAQAETFTLDESRKMMLSIAETYDSFAARAEAM